MAYMEKYRTDMDISDEPAGRARAQVAAESKARRLAGERQIASANAKMRTANRTVAQRTDDDISDEAAGRARITMAAESKARKDAEARRLASANAQMSQRNRSTGLRTDVDISDEAAGRARITMAAESKARKEAEARRIASANAQMRHRNMTTAQRTDDDISDEAAGRKRLELAAESRALREAEARMLARKNAEMRQRIKRQQMRKRGDAARKEPVHRPGEREAASIRADQEEADEAAELQLLRAMLQRSSVAEKKEGGWNNSPYRPVPYALRGIRPMHTQEPWARDVLESYREEGMRAGSAYATAGLARLDDGLNDDIVTLRRRRLMEDVDFSQQMRRPAWDNNVWRYCPSALNGLKPVTPEPWLADLNKIRASDNCLDRQLRPEDRALM